ncbi:hypothetical protein RSOLAG22IIIB_07517 [Rhizoctonia solani]|uniref:ATP-dependent DNA helicase PIF1 n=1 Tax=Rhizoctonia solani TaxID=456999 RepID=A0A0K6FND2_9AGAM|nr:hypothetical protein RSOLAG22IIIB_07517 [Rhizoctonia solani]
MEQGRSVVWNQILQLRTPIEDLAVVDPELAGRLSQIMNQLNKDPDSAMADRFNDLPDAEKTTQQRHRVAEEYDKLIHQVRTIPGFQDFLKRKESKAIMSCARQGYVVVINAHKSRCGALVLQPGHSGVTHIPLPNLTLDKAVTARAQIEASLRRQNIRERGFKTGKATNERDRFKDALYFLWVDVVKPILDALELQPLTEVLPRITWCTTGALSFLPLHAAGDYGHPQERIYNYAISSYTPTLSAIMPGTTSKTLSSLGIKVLAVAQSTTPGHSDLPGTLQELENIRAHIHKPHQFTQLEGENATIDTVMQAMESHSWVHLACHAHQNTSNPTQSGFFLQDGVLSITQIAHKSLKNKGLAFLSACQTATGEISIADESVHLAAGMLVAGYPSVIATMWSIKDDDAPVVAACVYERLCGNEKAELHGPPEALHYAVTELRTRVGEEAYGRWVPYIHFGLFRHLRNNRFISLLGNYPYGARSVYRVSGTKPPGRSLTTLLDTVESPMRSGVNSKRPTSKTLDMRKEPNSLLPEDQIAIQGDELQESTPTLVFEKQEFLPDPELSEEQKYVFDKVMSGENVFFTGSAGTGKSVLLRAIIAALGGPSYEVAVTASTGIAATNIGGQTLHSFAGVGLGHGDIRRMVHRVKRDPAALARWLKAKILIIDEVSMVDASWFDQLEEIARQIRGKKSHFGGIQLVVCGDFFQLPPVANRDQIDAPASFVFDSFSWETCIKTKVMLTQVYRQKDPKLVKMLNDARVGVVTDESAKLLTSLARRVHYDDDIGTTELYPRRWDAYWANVAQLARLPEEGRTFYAYDRHGKADEENEVDPERAKLLFGRMIVPKRLRLKVGAQVMCLRNINARGLVNGSLGKVVDFMRPSQVRSYSENDSQWSIVGSIRPPSGESGNISPGDTNVPGRITRTVGAYEFYEKAEWPLVQFTNGQCVLMTPTNFTVETSTGVVEVERLQVPLVLAWALTVHKSQGQTLERVRINLRRTFEKGQAYVALSRCTSLDTLEVYGFDRERVQAHPRVQQWARTVTVLNSFTQPTSSSRSTPRLAIGGR